MQAKYDPNRVGSEHTPQPTTIDKTAPSAVSAQAEQPSANGLQQRGVSGANITDMLVDKTKQQYGDMLGVWSVVPVKGNWFKKDTWTNADNYRVFTPFADRASAYDEGSNPYTNTMSAEQKMETFQDDVKHQVNKNFDLFGTTYNILRDHGIDVNPAHMYNPREWLETAARATNTYFNGGEGNEDHVTNALDAALKSPDVKNAADKFVQASDIKDIGSYMEQVEEMASSMPNTEQAAAFKKYVADGLQGRVWDGIKANPAQNLPVAIGLFLKQLGLGGAADWVSNPIVFYGGMLLALAGGAHMIFGGSKSDKDDDDTPKGYKIVPYA